MKTTLTIDDELLSKAAELTGQRVKSHLVELGLQALITQESSRMLAALGGSEPAIKPIPRRRAKV
jgi:hypothetical protein